MNVQLLTTKDILIEEIEELAEKLLNESANENYEKKGVVFTSNGNRLSASAVNHPTIFRGEARNSRNIFVSGYDTDGSLYCLHVMDYNNSRRLTVTYEGDNYPTVIK
jgi:hypothetical protein